MQNTVIIRCNGNFRKMKSKGTIETDGKGKPILIRDSRNISFNISAVKQRGFDRFKEDFSFVSDDLGKLWEEVTGSKPVEKPKKDNK